MQSSTHFLLGAVGLAVAAANEEVPLLLIALARDLPLPTLREAVLAYARAVRAEPRDGSAADTVGSRVQKHGEAGGADPPARVVLTSPPLRVFCRPVGGLQVWLACPLHCSVHGAVELLSASAGALAAACARTEGRLEALVGSGKGETSTAERLVTRYAGAWGALAALLDPTPPAPPAPPPARGVFGLGRTKSAAVEGDGATLYPPPVWNDARGETDLPFDASYAPPPTPTPRPAPRAAAQPAPPGVATPATHKQAQPQPQQQQQLPPMQPPMQQPPQPVAPREAAPWVSQPPAVAAVSLSLPSPSPRPAHVSASAIDSMFDFAVAPVAAQPPPRASFDQPQPQPQPMLSLFDDAPLVAAAAPPQRPQPRASFDQPPPPPPPPPPPFGVDVGAPPRPAAAAPAPPPSPPAAAGPPLYVLCNTACLTPPAGCSLSVEESWRCEARGSSLLRVRLAARVTATPGHVPGGVISLAAAPGTPLPVLCVSHSSAARSTPSSIPVPPGGDVAFALVAPGECAARAPPPLLVSARAAAPRDGLLVAAVKLRADPSRRCVPSRLRRLVAPF